MHRTANPPFLVLRLPTVLSGQVLQATAFIILHGAWFIPISHIMISCMPHPDEQLPVASIVATKRGRGVGCFAKPFLSHTTLTPLP